MKINFINWPQVFCVLTAAFTVWWIYQYPYDRLFIPTSDGDSVIGPYTHTARAVAITYVLALSLLFVTCLYRQSVRLQEPAPAPANEPEEAGSWPPKPELPNQTQEEQKLRLNAAESNPKNIRANILFFLLLLPFLSPAIIGRLLPQYFCQMKPMKLMDSVLIDYLDGFAYLTSPPILAILFACAVPILAYYGILARCVEFLRRRFARSS